MRVKKLTKNLNKVAKYNFERIIATSDQTRKLYELLERREHKISHTKLPSYEEHCDFVKNNPYLHWYIVSDGPEHLGSFYIKKDNSIGLNICCPSRSVLTACLDFIKSSFTPQSSIASVVPNYFYVNVAYSNKKAIDTLEDLGLSPIQISLRF